MRIPLVSEFETGEPWRLQNDRAGVAVPILVKGSVGERSYRLLSEVVDRVSLNDTGNINRLQVVNNSDDAVFIRKGSIVKGDTQTRALTLSIIVAPKSATQAEIKCVYASKGIRSGASFEFSGRYTPTRVTSSLRESQSSTWEAVREHTVEAPKILMQSFSPGVFDRNFDASLQSKMGTDDLEGYLGAEESVIDEAMRNVPVDHVRQVGLGVIDLDGVVALELFDHPESWRALSKSVTRNYADILNKMAPDFFDINLGKVRQHVEDFLTRLRNMEGKVIYGEDQYRTYEVKEGRFVGEFTTSNDVLVHVLVTRQEKVESRPKPEPRSSPIYMINRIMNEDRRLAPQQLHREDIVNESLMPAKISGQDNAALKVDYLTKKRGYETLLALRESGKAFNELQRVTGMSTATVTKALREAEKLGLVQRSYRSSDASTVYELTADGKRLDPRKFKATMED
jgi:DNA-binding HxlR family transcriptional regulator